MRRLSGPGALSDAKHAGAPEHLAAFAPVGPTLTRRQRDVVDLLVEGRQNKLIAGALQISEHTVKVHIAAIMRLYQVTTRTALAARYLSEVGHAALSGRDLRSERRSGQDRRLTDRQHAAANARSSPALRRERRGG